MDRFVFENFIPLKDLERYANRSLGQLLNQMPDDRIVYAQAMRAGDEFYFCIRIRTGNVRFSSKCAATPTEDSSQAASLQKLAVDHVIDDLWDQLENWRRYQQDAA